VAFLVLSRAPPPTALLEFLCVREKERKMCFYKSCFGLKVNLLSEGTYDLINFIYLFIKMENPKGTTVTKSEKLF